MIKPEQIPDDVWVAAAIRLEALGSAVAGYTARDVIAAALAAWPGMEPHKVLTVRDNGEGYDLKQIGIILPLPQEARDE
jgi:hypothetical protein